VIGLREVKILAGGAATGLVVLLLLSGLSRAADQRDRLAALEAAAQQIERAEAQGSALRSPAALCREPLEKAAVGLAQVLRADALAGGAQVEALDVTPLADGPSVDLDAARVTMKLSGDDRSLLAFLRRASERRHPVAVERFEIAPSAGGLQADLSALLLCRRGAR